MQHDGPPLHADTGQTDEHSEFVCSDILTNLLSPWPFDISLDLNQLSLCE